jgi:hypothetical protein
MEKLWNARRPRPVAVRVAPDSAKTALSSVLFHARDLTMVQGRSDCESKKTRNA